MGPQTRLENNHPVERIMSILDGNDCGEIPRLREACHALGTSPSTLRRVLRRTMRTSFRALVQRHRVRRALLELTRDPSLKIEALAVHAGWHSRTSLYASVQLVTGAHIRTLRANRTLRQTALESCQSWMHSV